MHFTLQLGSFFKLVIGKEERSPLKRLLFVRHGESTGNSREEDPNIIGDHNLRLTAQGIQQAKNAGDKIGKPVLEKALIYNSPYRRTRETRDNALIGAGIDPASIRRLEDPRLREVEHGYNGIEDQKALRAIHGWFYYRFIGGESPGDCYDRSSLALESIIRQAIRKNNDTAVIFTHGLTVRCIIARFLHLTVEEFESLDNPNNGDIIEIAHHKTLKNPIFRCGRWGVEGIKLRKKEQTS